MLLRTACVTDREMAERGRRKAPTLRASELPTGAGSRAPGARCSTVRVRVWSSALKNADVVRTIRPSDRCQPSATNVNSAAYASRGRGRSRLQPVRRQALSSSRCCWIWRSSSAFAVHAPVGHSRFILLQKGTVVLQLFTRQAQQRGAARFT
jgi:hypothetical protein